MEGDQPALGMFQNFPAGEYNGVVLVFAVLILMAFYCYPVLQGTRKVSPRCFWAPRPLLQHGICLLWVQDQWLPFFCCGVFISGLRACHCQLCPPPEYSLLSQDTLAGVHPQLSGCQICPRSRDWEWSTVDNSGSLFYNISSFQSMWVCVCA